MNRRNAVTLCAALVLLVAWGCDFNPSSPFQGFDGGEGGATLTGRFAGAATSSLSTLRTQSAFAEASSTEQIIAVIYDSKNMEIARVKVENGTFTLRGLPEAFTLVFVNASGARLSEPMLFEGVKPNQEVDIVVEMVGGEVVLVEEKRTGIDHDDLEIQGAARNIQVGSDSMTGSLEVNGYRVVTAAGQTSIRKGNRSLTLRDLRSGDQVHVRGLRQSNGDVFAYEIKLQEPEDERTDGGKVTICHIPPGNPSNAKTITVDASAVPAHLAHGDKLGACGS